MFFRRKEKAPDETARLDWRLLERGAVALYYKSNVLAQDVAWFREHQYTIHELSASGWTSPADFHAAARAGLPVPPHYSASLASWIDCLAELAVPDEGGAVLVLRDYDAFARAQPELAQTILDSLECASRRFLLTGRRFLALVQSGDPRIRFERVGAVPVTWNPREWLDEDRGVGGAR
jgi:hypothetical protein